MNRIDNPQFDFDPEIAAALDRLNEEDERVRAADAELHAALAPTEEEVELKRAFAERSAEAAGLDESIVLRLQEQRLRKVEIAREFIDVRVKKHWELPPVLLDPPPPPPPSRDFWWARTEWSHTDHFSSSSQPDGLVFSGGPNGTPASNWLGDTDLIHAGFGAVAFFEIRPDRLPDSPSGLWFSDPHVDLSGGLLGHTTSGSFPNGDSWSKCWLHLDHQVFQWGFGPDGPAPLVRGQAHSVVQLLDEADDDRSFPRPLGGFTPLPAILFGGVLTGQSLWARLEVRFDVQIEGAGSFLWCDPVVRLVTHHWPLRVIS
jgi:hypothetical protein